MSYHEEYVFSKPGDEWFVISTRLGIKLRRNGIPKRYLTYRCCGRRQQVVHRVTKRACSIPNRTSTSIENRYHLGYCSNCSRLYENRPSGTSW